MGLKLVEVFLRQYGPVPETVLHLSGGIDLIYGPNESGKTLLVDALLKMLLGRRSGLTHDEDRVKERPDGYLRFEIDGITVKMETKQTLIDLLPEESSFRAIEPEEFRNIFIVRNSDLFFKDERKFYRGFVEKVVGTYSSEIEWITSGLRTRGRLTSTLQLSNSADNDFASSNAIEAKALARDIHAYLEEAEETGTEVCEAKHLLAKLGAKKLKERVDRLDMARQVTELEKLKTALSQVHSAQKKISEFDEMELNLLAPEVESLNKDAMEEPNLTWNRHMLARVSALALVLSVLFFAGFNLLVDNALLGFAAFMGMVIVCGLSLVGAIWMGKRITKLSQRRFALMERARRIGIEVEASHTLEDCIESKRNQFGEVHNALQMNWGVLRTTLELAALSPDEGAAQAEARIMEMEREVDLSISPEYDSAELKKTKARLYELEKEVDKLQQALLAHKQKLGGLSERFASLDFRRFLDRDVDLQLENLDALRRSMTILEELADKIERKADAARTAIQMFDELMREETERIKQVFRKNGPASSIFSSITGGRYGEVFYETREEEVMVKRPSGDVLPVRLLSKGATDQLYLSVRIALAKRLLEDQQGFFIFDDVLLSSDGKRLEKQVKVLKGLANDGWQVIYFTSQDDTLKAMKKVASAKPRRLLPLP